MGVKSDKLAGFIGEPNRLGEQNILSHLFLIFKWCRKKKFLYLQRLKQNEARLILKSQDIY